MTMTKSEAEVLADMLAIVAKMTPRDRRDWLLIGRGVLIGATNAKYEGGDNNAETSIAEGTAPEAGTGPND